MEVTEERKMEVSASLPNLKSSLTKQVATVILTENMCKLNFTKPKFWDSYFKEDTILPILLS